MFEFFKRILQLTKPAAGAPLLFRDGGAALEYMCRYMECPLREGGALPAVVVNAAELFGTSETVRVLPDGNQVALLRVGSADGGFLVLASTAGPKGPRLCPGQFVLWEAGRHSPAIARKGKDEMFGWVGLIVGTLKPEYRNGAWMGGERFLT